VASSYLVAGTGGGRYGNGHPSIVPYTTYPTLDGLVAVAVGNDGQFARFAAAVGHAEWARDERFAARRMVETVQHPTVGALRLLGIPFTLTATPATVRHPPPTLGQHTDEILGQELGLSARRIDELRARAVI
jgi:crotonobetainyl-CoA:carnitine CoA-transferase CaiB-like acyl-CoA transferase